MPHEEGHQKTTDEVYHDRNVLALAFVSVMHDLGYPAGVRLTDDPDWPVVVVELPGGEVGWHIPFDLYKKHREWLPRRDGHWNGYPREVKNDRLEAFARAYIGEGEESQ